MKTSDVELQVAKMLADLPPAVADRLRAKYEADRLEFLSVVEDMTPSKDPAYWAKRACTKCYGRGTIGSVLLSSGPTPLSCACVDSKYRKWIKEIRKYYLALKEQGQNETPATPERD
jgi:hypothetical protein